MGDLKMTERYYIDKHAGHENYPLCAPRPHKTYAIIVDTLTPEEWHATEKHERCPKCSAIIANKLAPEYER